MSHSDLDMMLRQLHDMVGQILGMREGSAPSAQRQPTASAAGGYFDFSNRAHRMAAEAEFERLGINEKRRSWFYNKALHGVRIGELTRVIEEADAEYRRMFPQGGGGRSWRR